MKDRIVKSNTCQNLVVGYSLIDVAYIPPHVDDLLILLDDYKMFVHNDKINIPHLVRCAVAHYQFETLHPFQEVNGLMKTGEWASSKLWARKLSRIGSRNVFCRNGSMLLISMEGLENGKY